MGRMREYRLADPLSTETETALAAFDGYTKTLLARRNITDATTAEAFIKPDYDTLHDPFLLHDMEAAVERIVAAIAADEKIAIYSDYDCDGIPGGVLLHDCFTAVGYENFINYIPHRHFEGFGLNSEAVTKLAAEGVKLIITVDCGTSDVAAIAAANELGVDVIVTDHHEPGTDLPEAVAIVNPKLGESYPFSELCGTAVAFKLAQALLARTEHTLAPGQEKWWLDLVGIATVADMVPLVGENRVLAHYGLLVLKKTKRPGLQHLFKQQRVNPRYLSEEDIGFTIGPRVNAASRMGTPHEAFTLLATTDEGTAGEQVRALEKLNNERKGLVASMSKEINARLEKMSDLPAVLVLGNPEWRPALVGLAANKLAEAHSRPAFVWGRDGNGVIKGSCRSGGEISVVNLMRAIPEKFIEHGGHHYSGGFAVADKDIHTLARALEGAYETLGEAAAISEPMIIDAELSLEEVGRELLAAHATLAPFGVGNDKPLYRFVSVTPKEVTLFGKTKEHLKLVFDTDAGPLEAIAFFKTPADWPREPVVGESLTLIGHVESSFFMGRLQTRIRIVDII